MVYEITLERMLLHINGDPIAIYKGGWDEKECVYEDTPTFDQEKFEEMLKKYGDYPVRCISTSVNTTDPEWINIAFLI